MLFNNYHEFHNNWNVEEYFKEMKEVANDKELDVLNKKEEEYRNAIEKGYKARLFKGLGNPIYVAPSLIPEVFIRTKHYAYHTNNDGDVYAYIYVILCKSTNTQDLDGKEIFETANGKKLVGHYEKGSPYKFREVKIMVPRIVDAILLDIA